MIHQSTNDVRLSNFESLNHIIRLGRKVYYVFLRENLMIWLSCPLNLEQVVMCFSVADSSIMMYNGFNRRVIF